MKIVYKHKNDNYMYVKHISIIVIFSFIYSIERIILGEFSYVTIGEHDSWLPLAIATTKWLTESGQYLWGPIAGGFDIPSDSTFPLILSPIYMFFPGYVAAWLHNFIFTLLIGIFLYSLLTVAIGTNYNIALISALFSFVFKDYNYMLPIGSAVFGVLLAF